MNKEFKAKWLKALRSREYKQAVGRLRTDSGYCCLGVACDISNLGMWLKGEGEFIYITLSNNNGLHLPPEVQKAMGIKNGIPFIDFQDTAGRVFLSDLNDDGFTFEQIADIIEYFL